MKKLVSLLVVFCVATLAACANTPPSPAKSLDFSNKHIINLDVADIRVVEDYKSPLAAPNIEHLMPYSPAEAMKVWVRDRLRATGANKWLQVTIVDASVLATNLPKTKGLQGVFTVDQDKKYEARLEVVLRIYGDSPLSEADTTVSVTRSVTIPENYSVNQRNAAYEKLIREMMEMLNDKLEKNIQNYFGNYVSY